jgi:uncharacterized protein (TIGR02246 family)
MAQITPPKIGPVSPSRLRRTKTMKHLIILSATLATAGLLTACNTAPANTHDADVKAIQDTEAQWIQDWAAKDLAKITSHYTDDATLIIAGEPPVTGKATIQTHIKQITDDPVSALTFHTDKVDTGGDLGYSEGTYTLALTDPDSKKLIHDHGTYLVIYRKQADGNWKAAIDTAITEVPPAMPAPTPTKKH